MGAAARATSRSGSARRRANFAEMAKREGVGRVVYLGGLGDEPRSKHLRSRAQTAEILGEQGPPLTYFRAAMVVGAGSESYRTLRYLVQRLPAMIAPAWLSTPTQPIAVDDVIAYLERAPDLAESTGREVQIGGPDVLSYGDMLDRMAMRWGSTRGRGFPVPAAHPAALVAVDRPRHPSRRRGREAPDRGALDADHRHRSVRSRTFGIEPLPFAEALRRALAEDSETKISG